MDFYYNMLALSVDHGDGLVRVCRGNYDFVPTGYSIPDGEKTILSLVVQSTGEYEVFANGTEVASVVTTWDMTALLPDEAWKDAPITIGRNIWDGWSTFNGNIGDVYVYRVALVDEDRQALEADLAKKFDVTLPTLVNPPTDLVATGGAAQVELTWSAPTAGTPPTGYLISRAGTQIADVPPTPTSFVDRDEALVPGSEYCYTVRSRTDVETSAPSNQDCATPTAGITPFHRGDANGDGDMNITDGIFVLNFLFLGGTEPDCKEAADANNDADVNITDGIFILNFLFLGGSAPPDPGGPDSPCGPDPDLAGSAGDLGCLEYLGC